MKVCMVLASDYHGGLEKHVRELSHCLVEEGHQVAVIAPTLFLQTLNSSVEKHEIDCKKSRYNPLLLLQLLRHLKAVHADIIHAQANKAARMVGLLSYFIQKPKVATLHSMKSHTRDYSAFKHVICVSQQLAKCFTKQQVSVVYNGIHPPKYKKVDLKNSLDLPMGYPVICAVGRLVKAKGFDVLIDAVKGLPLSLIIAGDGPLEKSLQLKIDQADGSTCFRLLGHREDVNDLIYSSDAVVISSRREGFSYVFNEAVLCQANVLATDVPVANEVLPAELIVPIGDAAALRSRLVDLLANRAYWQALMSPVSTFVMAQMQCVSMTRKTIAVYQSILDARVKRISHQKNAYDR